MRFFLQKYTPGRAARRPMSAGACADQFDLFSIFENFPNNSAAFSKNLVWLLDSICLICFLLYKLLRRKPGWRFTAGCTFYTLHTSTHENADLKLEAEDDAPAAIVDQEGMPTLEQIQKNILKISQNEEFNVKNHNSFKAMDTKELTAEFEKMLDSKLGKKSEFSQESVASMATVIMDKIREKDAEWKLQKEAAETEKADAITRAEEAKANIEDFKKQLEEAQEKISSLEGTIATAKAEELFNSRMENIDSQYDLEDSDRAVLAKEVAALESSEAAFETYQQKLEVILKHKGKAYKEEQEAAFQSKVEEELQKRLATIDESKASTTEEATVEDLVENVEVSEEPAIVNNNEASSQEESLRDKFMKAFNPDTVSVTY